MKIAAFIADIRQYIGFDHESSKHLRRFLPHAEPHLDSVVEAFYSAIEGSPQAAAIFEGPEQIQRLKDSLRRWLSSGLQGPHDDAFFRSRLRIGEVHVRVQLPQQYMVTAMHVLRLELLRLAANASALREGDAVATAVHRWLDMELALMLHSYRVHSEDHLKTHERLATIGQLSATIAHELRNPLGVIESSAYLLRRRVGDDDRALRHLDKIVSQVQTSAAIITNLLELAKDRPVRREAVLLSTLVEQSLARVTLPPEHHIERDFEPEMAAALDLQLFSQALANVVQNASAALGAQPGTITIRAEDEGGHLKVSVQDTGPGFDPNILARAFEPLVTSKASGTGLGLALVKRICEGHGGDVEAANAPERGAVVTLSVALALPQRERFDRAQIPAQEDE